MEKERLPKNAALSRGIGNMVKNSQNLGFDPDDPGHLSETISYLKRKHRHDMAEELPVTPTLKWAEYKGHALLGLNTSELITRIALFE
jgi:hypothetical protein